MKFLSLAVPALLATSATARTTGLFSTADVTPRDDTKFSVPGDNPLEHCADPKDDVLAIKSVDLDPNPPLAGKTLSITAKGILAEDVEEGAVVHLSVKYGLITIIRQTADLCETVKKVDLECPLKKGEIELVKEVDLPKEIPPGKYTVEADVVTKGEDKVTCLKATVQFTRGGSSFFKQGL
ncbi:hypothetical protein DOTSEDRAFT_75719 [Dothistroma septosporum NZE10]|uniref:Phosphatidylglycerol/phosphatidylinositol transfer protein n=1 Tax=Dothistroma septosporum (strain NZE10 / CBS 128990) TaxID=675120 RepID=N1PBY4_DOTSN|nr:hypothetical protein DOTSEDRAFT_75719 [Dothistroma septosporum NZE10]